ncbi:carbonic anhydrase/acetyltransferase-like protein (isoleucine patch superfamily) [Dongia mobilis]|uniref:Carbonic anhydrase/acetyltransferase-like protein (Isoleucine patch superfamily) n=1 Tax=Dongia mobilis TaxID=578943 RepID=A0A4R6WLB0_9PROT|nr:gamma carbonic anhydrase family protein [Dongia mobilis]TDQ81336.1 carbonic anhydrase/acetyltransferase-like protein (isoleucine patch superfamily) [Dongia mobilis]
MAALVMPYKGIHPRIAADAFVAPTAVIIGDVEIGAEASVWFGCVLRGDSNSIRIGPRTNVQDGTVIHVNHEREGAAGTRAMIGADVTIGHMALLHACTVEDGAFIGMKACVMDGVIVEGGAMVAAGALVTPGKRIRKGELWAGSPAKLMRPLSDKEMAYFAYSSEHYCRVAASYRD